MRDLVPLDRVHGPVIMSMLRRSKRLIYAQGIYPEANCVYLNSDLMLQVIFFLDWPTLFRLSQACRDSRQLVRDEVTTRLRFFIHPFVMRSLFEKFMAMLRETRSAIVGGLPFCFLNLSIPAARQHGVQSFVIKPGSLSGQLRTLEMQVFVPRREWKTAIDWLEERNFEFNSYRAVAPTYQSSISRIAVYGQPVGREDVLYSIPVRVRTLPNSFDVMMLTSIHSAT